VGTDAEGRPLRTVLSFHLGDLELNQSIAFARLRVASEGSETPSPLRIRISGGFSPEADPSRFATIIIKTARPRADIMWSVRDWSESSSILPLYYETPNLAPIINGCISRAGSEHWGKHLNILLEPAAGQGRSDAIVKVCDYSHDEGEHYPAILEVYTEPEEAFIAPPMLGRPTDTSITINLIPLMDIDIYAQYGTRPGSYDTSTEALMAQPGGQPIEISLGGLDPNTTYYYRLAYRPAGTEAFVEGMEGHFRTQRAKGEAFSFTIQADTHILSAVRNHDLTRMRLYEQTLKNALADDPDFHIDMGDFAHIEFYAGQSARTSWEAVERYLMQRQFLGELCRSAPFFLVLGNHEAEQGWRTKLGNDSLEVWGTLARKAVIPNPHPDGFYSGNQDLAECCGLREDYYAWQWGDALLVVLDPFWYTTRRPHRTGGLYSPSFDGWDWTLGKAQYHWLYSTLTNSDAKWKFVFAHHMTGGVLGGKEGRSPYGRGGIDAAKYKVAGRPTFEWGGEDSTGRYVFEAHRQGWEHGSIHDMMVEAGVDIFFRGHDHAFIYEDLDGIVYQTCPQPADKTYSSGEYRLAFFTSGMVRNSPGHLRVTVSPDSVRVDYVRSILAEDEPLLERGESLLNGDISYSYTIKK
jgi:hypothetical protein